MESVNNEAVEREGEFAEMAEAEALILQAEQEADIEGAALEPEPEDEPLSVSELARQKARAMVRAAEKLFRLKVPGFSYSGETYERAEEELAPVLEKYELTSAGPMKYSEEIDGAFFLGGLLVESVGAVKAHKAEREAQRQPGGASAASESSQLKTQGQSSNGGQSQPFTTQ